MNKCPNCGAPLALNEKYCPDCGAAVRSTRTRNVNVTLSRREARRGCMRTLRYPGAPAPIKVRMPKKLYNGAELYLNDVPFLAPDGSVVRAALKITVSVPRRRVLPFLALLFLLIAAAAAILLYSGSPLPRLELPLGIFSPATPQPTPSPAPAEPAESPAAVTPEPTPYVPPLSPMQQKAAALIPNFELRYYLSELDDRLLENFCALYGAVSRFETQCEFPQPLSREELANLMLLLSYECPELLQFSSATEMNYLVDENGRVLSVALELCLSEEQYLPMYQSCAALATEAARATQGLSELERELYAYNLITENCFYSFDAPNSANAYGALVEGQAKCDGISLAMKWLCEEMGITCMVVAGTAPGEEIGHAWNVLCIDGTYYDLDVTNDVKSEERSERYYGAFNVSRYWIRDDFPENRSFADFIIVPGSENMNMSFHALTGSYVYTGCDVQSLLFERLDQAGEDGKVYIQFESFDDYSSFINNINDIMSAWDGIHRGSFNYSLSHLDEFQVCCISVSFI